jgi:hypothetical protein
MVGLMGVKSVLSERVAQFKNVHSFLLTQLGDLILISVLVSMQRVAGIFKEDSWGIRRGGLTCLRHMFVFSPRLLFFLKILPRVNTHAPKS